MTKVLFYLSAVVMVVAGMFSFQNREAFVTARLERQKTVKAITSDMIKLKNLGAEIAEVSGKVTALNTEVATEQERMNQANIKFRNARTEGERLQLELQEAQGKIKEYKDKITDIPAGFTVETMTEDLNKLKQSIAEAEAQRAKVEEVVATKDGELKRVQAQLNDVLERIETRKKSFDSNSLSAPIVAVNNDWGFVVIEAGENQGITADAKLLVTRGTQAIAKLKIISVDGGRTVANIDQESLRSGFAVVPGDRVIMESLYR